MEIFNNLNSVTYVYGFELYILTKKKKKASLDLVVVDFFWELRMPSLILACEELECAPLLTEAVPEVKTAEHMEAAAFGHQKC